jgi:hypothetical protein
VYTVVKYWKELLTAVTYSSSCSTGKNAWIVLEISWNSDRTSPETQDIICFCTCTFDLIKNKCAHGLCVHRCEDNMKMGHNEIGCKAVAWIHLT